MSATRPRTETRWPRARAWTAFGLAWAFWPAGAFLGLSLRSHLAFGSSPAWMLTTGVILVGVVVLGALLAFTTRALRPEIASDVKIARVTTIVALPLLIGQVYFFAFFGDPV